MGSGQSCFRATCGTVKPFDNPEVTRKSLFGGFANVGIFAKWSAKVLLLMPGLFAILSCGIPSWFNRKVLRSKSKRVVALKSAIYKSTACLDLPIALPISADVNLGFDLFQRDFDPLNNYSKGH
jgi:hypothetical protein